MATLNAVSYVKHNPLARYPLLSFFSLAIILGWLSILPSLVWSLPFKPLQTIGAYGPFLAALIVTAAQGGEALKAHLRRITNFRIGVGWYLVALLGYVGIYLAVTGISGAPLRQSLTVKWPLLVSVYLPAMLTNYLVNAIGEEAGWAGFAQYQLQRRFRPWLAAVILGVLWAAWHLPAYLVPSEMGAFNPVGFVIFTLMLVSTRVIWGWATNYAKGSAIIAMLLHASSNATSLALIPRLLPQPTPDQMAISGLILMGILLVMAILLILLTRGRLGRQQVDTA